MTTQLPPIVNFQPFDPSKVQLYRNRRAMILASIPQPKTKKIKLSEGNPRKPKLSLVDSVTSLLSPAQQAMFALAMKGVSK